MPGATRWFTEFAMGWQYSCEFSAADAGRLDWAQRCVAGMPGHTVTREGYQLRISRGDGHGFTILRVLGKRVRMAGS